MMLERVGARTTGFVALGAAALLIAGCSGTAPGTSAGQGTDGEISGEIRFATWWDYVDQDVIDGFTEMYPDVTVKLEYTAIDGYESKLQTQAAAGTVPDVFALQGTSATGMESAGKLLDLSDALGADALDSDRTWRDSFSAALLDQVDAVWSEEAQSAGASYAVPFNAVAVANVYNADIFDEVGISPATTLDELLDNCRALNDAGYIPMSLTGATWITWWPNLAWDQSLRDVPAGQFSPEAPGFEQGFDVVKQIADAGCWRESQISADIATEQSLFLQQKTAQFVSVPEGFLKSIAEDASFEVATAPLPGLGDKEPVHTLGGGNSNMIAVGADSQNSAAAVAFAKYLTSEKVQGELAASQFTLPSLDMDVASSNDLMQAYIDAASGGFIQVPPPTWTQEGAATLRTTVLPSLILGKITPAEAAEQAAELLQ